jgi:hypothetical protein
VAVLAYCQLGNTALVGFNDDTLVRLEDAVDVVSDCDGALVDVGGCEDRLGVELTERVHSLRVLAG